MAGGIVGGLGFLLGGLAVFFLTKQRNRRRTRSKLDQPLLAKSQGATSMEMNSSTTKPLEFNSSSAEPAGSVTRSPPVCSATPSATVSSAANFSSSGTLIISEHAVNEIPYAQIATITNDCAEILGQGGFATVYKGTFYRQEVAVKVDKKMTAEMEAYAAKQFVAEIHTLYKVSRL